MSAIVEGGPQVGLPFPLAPLHPWGVAPASWVRRARCCAPPMLASRGTPNGTCAFNAWPVGLVVCRSCVGCHASLPASVGRSPCAFACKYAVIGIWQWKRDFRGHLPCGGGSLTSAVAFTASPTPGSLCKKFLVQLGCLCSCCLSRQRGSRPASPPATSCRGGCLQTCMRR